MSPVRRPAAFLEDALAQLGLTRTEANEFIIYWLPRMQENAYNLIAFQHEAYTESARLTITPEPDTLIRVFMGLPPAGESGRDRTADAHRAGTHRLHRRRMGRRGM